MEPMPMEKKLELRRWRMELEFYWVGKGGRYPNKFAIALKQINYIANIPDPLPKDVTKLRNPILLGWMNRRDMRKL